MLGTRDRDRSSGASTVPPRRVSNVVSRTLATVLSGGILAALVSPAHAESPSLAGAWNAGPLSEVVTVHSWPEECGPKPKGGNAGAGPYTIGIIGDELVFSGARPFRSDECWDRDSAKRVSHSATLSARSWKTRCESPAGDARKATITTLVRATDDDTLVMSESAKYEAPSPTAGGGACSVTVDRSRIYKRAVATIVASTASATASTTTTPSATVAPTASTTAAPTTTTTTAPPPKCDSVGEARTLEVRPKKKILRAGEQFDVVARLLDDKGCEVSQKPTFKLAAESSGAAGTVTVDASGRVTAKASAEPGKLQVLVEAGGKSFKVEVEIVTDARWAELLSAGGLEDAGDEPAVVVVSTGGGAVGATPSKPVAGPAESRRQFAWLAVIGGACTLLLLVALILWRRGGPAKPQSEPVALAPVKPRHGPHTPMPLAPPAFVPPPPPPGVAGPPKAETAVGFSDPRAKRCPLCGQAAPFEAEFCPNDGQRLVAPVAPAAAPVVPAAGAQGPAPAPRGKMCPVCARRYEAEARFCNKDGVALVDVN